MFKKFLGVILSILAFGLFLLFAIISYDNQKVNLDNYSSYENIVIKKGIEENEHNQKVFYVILKGLNQKNDVYRTFKNYRNLENEINIGEKIKIYYKQNLNKRISNDH
ncbi:MAG: hypothetical protein QM564_04860 [Bergeyella sp.]